MEKVWTEIVEFLRGTCDTLEHALAVFNREDLEDNTKFLEYLDSEIFRCADCSWWSGVEEIGDSETDLVCRDCFQEDEGDE